ncbi:MAG: hypothetical protein ACREAZ_09390 [Nitrososphaera sp.]
MTQEDQKYFDVYLELFDSEGWRQFIQDLSGSVSDLERNGLASAKGNKSLYRLKGKLEGFTFVLNFEDAIKRALEEPTEVEDL